MSELPSGFVEVPEAIAVITSTQPDVVLLDVHLPEGGGVAVLEALHGAGPKVLALSVSDAAEDVVPMIRAGALGYLVEDNSVLIERLLDAAPKKKKLKTA